MKFKDKETGKVVQVGDDTFNNPPPRTRRGMKRHAKRSRERRKEVCCMWSSAFSSSTWRILCVVFMLFVAVGCNQQQQDEFTANLTTTRRELTKAEYSIAELRKTATTMPAGEAKDKTLELLTQAETIRSTLAAKVAAVDSIMVSAKAGDDTGVGGGVASALAGIPYIGPYAPLIGLAAGIAYGVWQRKKRTESVAEVSEELATTATHLSNVVKSMELAGPNWSETDKKEIAAIQGKETSAEVERIKTGL